MSTSLISTTSLVQTPVITVKIGDYEFGKYTKINGYSKYPNYIDSLQVTKINGQVNTYSLVLIYPITEYNDPNYFEKVFSSVSTSRRIEFNYGDMSQKNFMYKKEVAIITNVKSQFMMDSAKIQYTVEAVSQGSLAGTGTYTFPAQKGVKPSDIIYDILSDSKYGLQDLFPGMRNITLCKSKGLIASNDLKINLVSKVNVSVLDYLQYLVDNMMSVPNNGIAKKSFYIMKFVDDMTDEFGGSYFKIVEVDVKKEHPEAYELEVGYPNANCVFGYEVENSENYSIFYDYQTKLNPQEYISRINPAGEYEEVYAPILSSGNSSFKTQEQDKSWWTKISQFPIKASINIKGLLRPAILMSYVRLYVYFYGRKHINSGLYIVSKQVDTINSSGFSTKIDLIKISNDDDGVF